MSQETQARSSEQRLKVICGANVEELDNCYGLSIPEIKAKMAPILNITGDHTIVLLNGKEMKNPNEYLLQGNEELEFKKIAGQKG